MSKHTPGPWKVVEGRSGDSIEVFAEKSICEMWRRRDDSATVRANARLIAAAPTLLEALKRALGEIDSMKSYDCDETEKVRYMIIYAIKRAEGGE